MTSNVEILLISIVGIVCCCHFYCQFTHPTQATTRHVERIAASGRKRNK